MDDEEKFGDKYRDSNSKLQSASGVHVSNDPLTSFLYELMRDHLPIGVVHRLVADSPKVATVYTNGWLARYAGYLSSLLRPDGVTASVSQEPQFPCPPSGKT